MRLRLPHKKENGPLRDFIDKIDFIDVHAVTWHCFVGRVNKVNGVKITAEFPRYFLYPGKKHEYCVQIEARQ